MTFQELLREVVEAAERSNTDAPIYGISAETYRMWKATSGNAKARRRWRRRNLPNTQRMAALAKAVYGATVPHIARPNHGMAAKAPPFVMPIDMKIEPTSRVGLKGDVVP